MEPTIDCPKTKQLVDSIAAQFINRATSDLFLHIEYSNLDDHKKLLLNFKKGAEIHTVEIPLPFEKSGVTLIQQNNVVRAVCPFWVEAEGAELDYFSVLHHIILNIPMWQISKKDAQATAFLKKVINAFGFGNASIMIYRFQKAINEIINYMPLHETTFNSYIMNNRLIVIDPEFEILKSPEEMLSYQVQKAEKYFPNWLAFGLSDSNLSSKNYMIKGDVRKLTPFGLYFHNPQRNLYQTFGMKGDEYPNIRSRSMQDLMDKGIARKGWNLFTVFADIPDVFEDQIMVDISHMDKQVEYSTRVQVYGDLLVEEGQKLKTGDVVGRAPDGEKKCFETVCDSAAIDGIRKTMISVGGTATPVINIIIKYKRSFRDGIKLTNLHGNKGIVRFKELGYAIDPITGEKRKIDIIVGGKTVGKRKNYGQVLEAMANCVLEVEKRNTEALIIEDEWRKPVETIFNTLVKHGYNEDCTMECDTYTGKFTTVCGVVFWGCIKTPEDQIWEEGDTTVRNGKEVRIAGLKFSHVEFKALQTRFGEDNPISDEIMSYAQGGENIREMLIMMESRAGHHPKKPVLTMDQVKAVNQTSSTIIPGNYIDGTIVDEYFMPDGFNLQLPIPLQTVLNEKNEYVYEGPPGEINPMLSPESPIKAIYITDKLYIPSGVMRKCWRHDTCNYGLSDIGVLVNNVIVMSQRLIADPQSTTNYTMYFRALRTLFSSVAKILGTKRGAIATYGMAVRYPLSVKATATLSNALPKNTVEIHRSMAKQMNINDGDIVIAERFPCLGFMSVRPQKVKITDDEMCRYTIRASGNSLVSFNLDFDGDTLYLASFHTPEARKALEKEWTNPNPTCYSEITWLNERKGAPHVKGFTINDFEITAFGDLNVHEYSEIVEKNVGVKNQTGPIIAFTYNIMRIVENSTIANDLKSRVAIEMFLEKAAQSVFEQKHGTKSLYEMVIDGVCTGDVEMLTSIGFKRGASEKICNLIKERALSIGVTDLVVFHLKSKKGGSKIVNAIVRKQNRIYFASRSVLPDILLLESLSAPAVDIPSKMFKWIMSGRNFDTVTEYDKYNQERMLRSVKTETYREAANDFCDVIQNLCSKSFNK